MAALDPKKAKANIALAKVALRKAATPSKDGKGIRVGFAFAPGKDKTEHILVIDPRKRAQALMAEIVKQHKDRKQLSCGTATVVKEGGKLVLSIKYVKKLAGAERKMQEALRGMTLQYLVRLESEEEEEDIAEQAADDAADALEDEERGASDDDDAGEAAASGGGADDEENAAPSARAGADDDEEDEEEDEDEDEEEEDDEEEAAAPSSASAPGAKPAPPAAKLAALGAAPQVWTQTRSVMSKSLDQLSDAIRKEYASEPPEVLADIEKGMAKMSQVTARFDHRLAEAMEKAHKAKDEAARKAELAKAKAILTEHIKYVQSEPMIAHIDANPFGVQTNLKKVLTASLTHMAKVIS
jgi:hypothetical protein